MESSAIKFVLPLVIYVSTVLVGSTEFRHTIHGTRGVISSPNYPRHYPLNTTVVWLISVEPSNTIQINFTHFNLEKNKKCIYDYVYIEERLMGGGSITRKYCGHRLPPNFTSVSNKIKVVFVSDKLSNVELGFRAKWREVYGSSLNNFVKPSKSTICIPTTVTISKPCTQIQASPSVATRPIKPSKCLCSKITQTVTKTVKVTVSNVAPSKSVSSVSATPGVMQRKEIATTKPKDDVSNNRVDGNGCDPSSPYSLVDEKKQVADKDRSRNLVVSLGVVLIALFITNIFLLVLLCKRERGYTAISFNSLKRYLSGRSRSMQSTPDMFFSTCTRPTLRMIDGEIVVVQPTDPSSPDSEHMRVLLEPYNPDKQVPQVSIHDQLNELPLYIVPQEQNTLNSGTDETTLASTRTDVVSDNDNNDNNDNEVI